MSKQAKLRITLFGGMAVKLGETAVTDFASRKAAALLAYLVCQPKPHPRETLATLLWPDNQTSRALGNLSVALNSLRKSLADFIEADRHTIAFVPQAPYTLDVAQFEREIAGAQAPKRGRISRTVAAQLETAVSRYTGGFLAGFHVRKAAEFEAWVLLEHERLERLQQEALASLIQFHQQRSQFQQAISRAQQLLAFDTLQERVQRQLMTLYAQNGQYEAALQQYEQCAAVLAQELDVAPEARTTQLYEQIAAGKGKATSLRPTALLTVSAPQHNLPQPTTAFIGRETERKQIYAWLAEPNGRLLSIVGAGGVGKTRLAQEVARSYTEQFADGVWNVSLAEQTTFVGLVRAIADVVGLTLGNAAEPAKLLVRYLRRREMLLLLDNFEQLLSEQSQALLTQLTHQAPELKLLVTSRERLQLQAERLLLLRGLPYPSKQLMVNSEQFAEKLQLQPRLLTADRLPLTDYGAVQLFVDRVRRTVADYDPASEETAVVALCQLVDGLPLALELAATGVYAQKTADIAAQIEHNLTVLSTSYYDVAPRHRSFQAVFDFSWQLLSAAEQEAYTKLAVFRGGFTAAAAAAVVGSDSELLQSLVDKSLLRLEAEADSELRYSRHPLLLQLASEKFDQHPQKTAVWYAYARFFGQFMQQHEANLLGGPPEKSLPYIRPDVQNIQRAWHWAAEQKNGFILNQMGDSVMQAFDLLDLYQAVVEMAERGIAALAEANLAERETAVAYGRSLGLAGAFYFRLGNYHKAQALCQQSIAVLAPYQPHIAYAHTLVYAGAAAYGLGNFEAVHPLWEAASNAYKAVDSLWGQTVVAQNQAQISIVQGENEAAYQFAEHSLKLAQAMNNHELLGGAWQMFAHLAIASGDLTQAYQYAQEGVDSYRQIKHQAHASNALATLGTVAFEQGNYLEAQQHFIESVALARESNNHLYLMTQLIHLGKVQKELAELENAEATYLQALYEALTAESQELILRALGHLAEVALAQELWAKAARLAACVLAQEATAAYVRILAETVLQQAAAGLSPDLLAQAKADGEQTAVKQLANALLSS